MTLGTTLFVQRRVALRLAEMIVLKFVINCFIGDFFADFLVRNYNETALVTSLREQSKCIDRQNLELRLEISLKVCIVVKILDVHAEIKFRHPEVFRVKASESTFRLKSRAKFV